MKPINKALGLGALVLALSSCGKMNEPQDQTIIGTPISVAEAYAKWEGNLATVLYVEGEPVLASTPYATNATRRIAEATALIQSEISDGDEEPIKLMGKYKGNKFVIRRIVANGYQIDF